jgi:hypothetical protein
MIEIKKPSGTGTPILKGSGQIAGFTEIVNLLDFPIILISSVKTIIPIGWIFSFPDSDTVVEETFYLISYPTYSLQVSQNKNVIAYFSAQGAPIQIGGGMFTGHNSPQTIANAPTYSNVSSVIALQQTTNLQSQWVGNILWEIYYIESDI